MSSKSSPLPASSLRADPSAFTFRAEIPSTFAADVESGRLERVAIISGNREALGHGIYLDDRSIETALEAVAATGGRMRGAITHGNSILDFLRRGRDRVLEIPGYFENITRQGDTLAGDFQFFDSFRQQDPGAFARLMEMAAKTPDLFGLSAEPWGYLVYVGTDGQEYTITRDENGEWIDPPEGVELANEGLPTMRITRMRVAAFVDDPAANDGLFSRFAAFFSRDRSASSELAAAVRQIAKAFLAWTPDESDQLAAEIASSESSSLAFSRSSKSSPSSTPVFAAPPVGEQPPPPPMSTFDRLVSYFAADAAGLTAALARLAAAPAASYEEILAQLAADAEAARAAELEQLRAQVDALTTERDTARAESKQLRADLEAVRNSGHPAPVALGAAAAAGTANPFAAGSLNYTEQARLAKENPELAAALKAAAQTAKP